MSVTDYAGIAGLIAAALIVLWILLGGRNLTQTPAGRHRGTPSPRLPRLRR